jgi:hypothetical protein
MGVIYRSKIRHKILEMLYAKVIALNDIDDRFVHNSHYDVLIEDISTKLKVSVNLISEFALQLFVEEEIEIDFDESGRKVIRILNNGINAFVDQKYLLDGRKKMLEIVFDYLKIISGIILLCITIITFILSTIKNHQNSNDIKQLQKELKEIRSQIRSRK